MVKSETGQSFDGTLKKKEEKKKSKTAEQRPNLNPVSV